MVHKLLWKILWQFLKNYTQNYDPAIQLLGTHPRELKTYAYAKTCTQMFIAAVSIEPKSGTTQGPIN